MLWLFAHAVGMGASDTFSASGAERDAPQVRYGVVRPNTASSDGRDMNAPSGMTKPKVS